MATYSKDFIVKNGLQVGGHIMPDDNETYDLGSSSKKFRDLYLSAGTIYLGELFLKIMVMVQWVPLLQMV
jgi:hypothetical protein